jgi:predicted secreted acid phosphatase
MRVAAPLLFLLASAATAQPAPVAVQAPDAPAGMQWLYGSGEGAAASIETYRALETYVLARARSRPRTSVILADGATLERPSFVPCGRKPLAVVLDADETALQNLGLEYAGAAHLFPESELLKRWQDAPRTQVAPMPGAVTALRAIRARGVTVIFNSNRDAAKAAATAATMANAGLGPVRHGETLFLRGDAGGETGKDGRRSYIAKRWCVVAMAGDQLGDFSDRFNARDLPLAERRRRAATRPLVSLWGNGWFLLSNPVYGPGLRGRIDEVFPADARWTGER